MVGVLGAVSVDHLKAAVVSLQREVDLQHVGAGLDDLQDTCTGKHHEYSLQINVKCCKIGVVFIP